MHYSIPVVIAVVKKFATKNGIPITKFKAAETKTSTPTQMKIAYDNPMTVIDKYEQ